MFGRFQRISAFAAAVAVLFVSMTCTSAGCLLNTGVAQMTSDGSTLKCCSHDRQTPRPASNSKHCPLCDNSNLIAKNIDQKDSLSADAVGAFLSFLPEITSCTFIACDSQIHFSVRAAAAPTLLALHCSLLA